MKISVITATYNCADTVATAFKAFSDQQYGAKEHVVIDGASRDGTLDVLNAHRQQIAVLVSEPDKGIYDALNKGIARCSGDVIGFLHGDDLYADQRVLARVAEAFKDDSVDAVYGDLDYVRREDASRIVRHWKSGVFSARKLAWGWMPPHPTLFVRREVYQRLGGFDLRFRIAADYDWMLRLLSQPDVRVVYIPEVLVKMRVGGMSNRSLKALIRKSSEDYRIMRKNGVGGAHTLVWKNLSKLPQFLRRSKPQNVSR